MFLQAWVHWRLKTVQTTAKNIRGQVHETVLQCKAKFGRNPRTNPYSRNAMTAKFWVAHDKILWQLPKYLINIFQSTRPPTSLGYFAATSKVEGTSSLFSPKRLRTMCWSMSESVRMTGYQRKSQLCWSTASSRVLLPNVQVAVDIYLYASGALSQWQATWVTCFTCLLSCSLLDAVSLQCPTRNMGVTLSHLRESYHVNTLLAAIRLATRGVFF